MYNAAGSENVDLRTVRYMKRRETIFATALLASLALHLGICASAIYRFYADEMVTFGLYLPGPLTHGGVLIERDSNRAGQSTGTGQAFNASDGELPMIARLAEQEQAPWSKDPIGPGRIGNLPSESLLTEMDKIPTPVRAQLPTAASDPPVLGIPSSTPPIPTPPQRPHKLIALATAAPAPQADTVSAAPAPDIQNPKRPEGTRIQNSPAPPAADPLPQGDSEIDAFSSKLTATADPRSGKVEARFGRNVRTTRPRLTLAAEHDLWGMSNPSVVLWMKLDETGKVVSADVVRTSGSVAVDQACQIALYGWWVEPPKDDNGNPRPDFIVMTLNFR
ncbi:MAG TPA: energy transducer TonB [Tepidisphaeraceae bacterium]